ncbi:putative bifunctional diguanylate cyclase/phosphodiesterase [Roseibium sp.]|uniref:putative bifunctional diguanylate cyclase/phosphodiesterase n=1 Tax=Roseibium sp. TaxID=1936156 RepID=UPI003A9729B9
MTQGDGPFIRLIRWIAIFTAVMIAVGPPALYLHFGYLRIYGEMTGEAKFKARQITRLINTNPDYWQFESIRIGVMIEDGEDHTTDDFHRVVLNDGTVVVQHPAIQPEYLWPKVHVERELTDYGNPVGKLEIVHTLEPLYKQSVIVAAFSLFSSIFVYWAFRMVPMRMLTRAWERITYLATHDALTDLPNRTLFIDRLGKVLQKGLRPSNPVTVYAFDLDFFKDINDTLGHAAGDRLLHQAACRMKECLREGDVLARLGGDEFAACQIGVADPQQAAATAERLIAAFKKPFDLAGTEAFVGVSIGIAVCTKDCQLRPSLLLNSADLALYKSKQNGRNTYHFFEEEMNTELRRRKSLEAGLRKALTNEDLRLEYQPQVELSTQKITGFEALARWRHPDMGEIPPFQFIPIAESSGMMRPLTEWILHKACNDAANWGDLKIAVNLAPSLFQQTGLTRIVSTALEESGLPPERLELEITEDNLIGDTERTLTILRELKEMGVQIAMDDFGTGFSSLGYLRQFPFDKIKIDRSFINDIGNEADADAIVRAIISMGHALKMNVIAEGVETLEQANILLAEGCEQVQGFLYGRPMPKRDIETLLTALHTIRKEADQPAANRQPA